jgi:hypothetical protein
MTAPVIAAGAAPGNITPQGGSYLQDPETGELTPLFVPGTGMDPDNTQPIEAGTPETPEEEDV